MSLRNKISDFLGLRPTLSSDKKVTGIGTFVCDVLTGLVGIGVLGLIGFAGWQYMKTFDYDRRSQEKEYAISGFLQRVDILRYNISVVMKPPLKNDGAKKIKYEDSFREAFQPMQNLSRREWQLLWDYIYKPIPEKNVFLMTRWRTKAEVEMTLRTRWEFFKDFSPKHWEVFWKIVQENKHFKFIVYDNAISEDEKVLLSKNRAILVHVIRSNRITFDVTGN
jgi:hypothetical protein